jgi:S-adenosylmethionine:tRNA ribosyltransferase-isomerase
MLVSEFDYHLPEELIAQQPATPRDSSRLMVVNRRDGSIRHDIFRNLLKYLRQDDTVVFNQTKVIPARIRYMKSSGGRQEIFLLRQTSEWEWEALCKPGLRVGEKTMVGAVVAVDEEGIVKINTELTKDELLSMGQTPLPPYIKIQGPMTKVQYQTVYARDDGSVAAPTAGLHFSSQLLKKIPNKEFLTLHVGLGTFKPVKVARVEDHVMHSEYYQIPPQTLKGIRLAKRVVAVGTTTVRTLESWARTGKTGGDTDIFIYPGFEFKVVGAMVTNFHLPKSTLMMLVCAFAGKELIFKAYETAIKEKYRFFSFGDGMLIT